MSALPSTPEALAVCLADPMWRLENLYKILVKGNPESGVDDKVIQFRPNAVQRRFIERLHHRNIILKARQLGYTSLITILWLDHALFNADQRCGIIAQDKDAAEIIFRDKVKFAYDHLPEALRLSMPLARDSASELLFAHNNSSVRVATSMRSGTIDRLHVSEFGKICAKYPEKANEVVTGSLPAAEAGIIVIESTAEGRDGDFYTMTQRAQANYLQRVVLTRKDYRFHFAAWWLADEYRMDPGGVVITDEDHRYFDKVEVEAKIKLDAGQRAWYVATRDAGFGGSDEKMWQEYPSTADEAFQVSTEGNYYAKDMALLRKRGGIMAVPRLDLPVNTFWDIGNSDGCGIWFHQESRGQDRFIGYYEAHGETLAHYMAELQGRTGWVWGQHFLPHDAAHKKLSDTNKSTEELLNDLGLSNTVIVPVITDLMAGVQMVRKNLKGAYFDETETKLGVSRLDGYKKKYSRIDNRFLDIADKSNGCTEGADSLRQWAQAKEAGLIAVSGPRVRSEPPPPPDWRL